MTPDLPQVQCAAAEPGASGRTGHWAQKQPSLFSSAQLQVCLVLFHECCAQKLLLLMCQQQSDFLKQGFDWGGGEWSGRRRFITPSCFSIGLLLEGKQGQLVLPSSAVFLIHRNNKASDLLPCHCRLTQRIIWMQWLGENSSLERTLTFSFGWKPLSRYSLAHRGVRCSEFVQGQLTQSQGLSMQDKARSHVWFQVVCLEQDCSSPL